MKIACLLVCLALYFATDSFAQTFAVTNEDGGSVTTDLGYNVKVNKKSSLKRTWTVINDTSCPVQLSSSSGIKTTFESNRSSGEYKFVSDGELTSKEDISAMDIRFILYDVFGNYMKTLKATQMEDISAEAQFDFSHGVWSWRAWEEDVSELLTVVTFVGYVRTKSGNVWRYNPKGVETELNKIRLSTTSGILEPTKEK